MVQLQRAESGGDGVHKVVGPGVGIGKGTVKAQLKALSRPKRPQDLRVGVHGAIEHFGVAGELGAEGCAVRQNPRGQQDAAEDKAEGKTADTFHHG